MIRLFLLFSVYQFLLHLYFALSSKDPRLIIPTGISFIHDLTLLAIIVVIGGFAKSISKSEIKNIIEKIFSILLILSGTLLAFYPKVLREFLVFPVNIFDSDLSSAETLLSNYLGFSALIPSIVALILGILVFLIKKEINISNKVKITFVIILFIFFILTMKKPSPQPLVYSLQNKIGSIIKNEKRVVASLIRLNSNSKIHNENIELIYSINELKKYNHILLIVMEGVSAKDFEKDFITIKNGFYKQNINKSVYYNNYYASNLDSYTSLISMLTSIQVPYRAYADTNLYNRVNEAKSITKDLQNRGFYTAFISTYEYQPFVPTKNYWNKIYDRQDLPTLKKWISLGSNKMESATEDKAAISTIIDNMKSNKKTFILHELVYGHSPEWRAKTGKTQIDYYNEYLLDLTNKLKKEKIYDKTLFVIVSDHGNRRDSGNIKNYKVPLLITGNKISSQNRDDFLNHQDIPRIIYHFAVSDIHPESREKMFLVGSTKKWVYGKVTKEKEYLFIDNNKGTILSQKGRLKPPKLREEFQYSLDIFNEKFKRR